jgi:large subunit ribosomal protein L30
MLKITLRKSTVKATKAQQASVRGLGLRKLRSSSIVKDTPETRGMIGKVSHLVEVEEVAE